jgi:uncharacterized protein YjbJ (UPF0337 family)
MSWELIQANWDQLRESVKDKWDALTEDDLRKAAGRRDWLIAMLRERYGMARWEAAAALDQFFAGPLRRRSFVHPSGAVRP